MKLSDARIAIIGLGYVGLPLSLEFSKYFPVIGFDISTPRISELRQGYDRNLEADSNTIRTLLVKDTSLGERGFFPTDQPENLANCNVYIITVPTPITESKQPDLSPLQTATEIVGSRLKTGDVVIFESTTFPGCTEEFCIPVLESTSKLQCNSDFFVGYSPERINPGDKINTLAKIKKITSGSTPETAIFTDELYQTIITAGTYRAPSIQVAEAAKAIENAQRDINISFVNELAIIFERMGIDTNDVLDAASTKWNFLKYKPGLVGGHCISVDPYYLAYKAEQVGYHPDVILSGRRVNDNMPSFIANKVIKLMVGKHIPIRDSEVLLLGITFKEDCNDIRNSKAIDIHRELQEFGCNVTVLDTRADKTEVENEFKIEIKTTIAALKGKKYDTVILAVAHHDFAELDIKSYCKDPSVIYDCKGFLERSTVDARL